MTGRRRLPRWARALLAVLLAGLLLYASLLSVVLTGAKDQVEGQPETMIVLGCQVHPWGPSILLQDRLDKALDYLSVNPETVVVVSGGQGPDEHTSEAAVMYDYLVEHGVDARKILVEDQSHNTFQNLTNTARLMAEQGLSTQDVLLVSNGFHLARAQMLWGRITGNEGPVSTLAAPYSHFKSGLWMHIREPLALAKSFVLDH